MKAIAALLLAATTLTAAPAEVKWETSLQAAQARAKAEHKVILLDVWTGWCGWCRKLQQDTFPSKEGQAALAKVVPLSIKTQEADGKPTKDNHVERDFQVDGYPTLLMLDANGKVIARQPGYLPPAPFAQWVASASKAN